MNDEPSGVLKRLRRAMPTRARSLTLVLCSAAASTASAATVNVTANSASALRTAMSNARAGDTLILTGTYNLGSTGITTNADGTASNRITLRSSASGATIVGTTANAGLGINHDYWTVQDLTIRGFVKSIRIDNAAHGVLSNIQCYDSTGESIKLRNTSQYWLIQNCQTFNSGAEGFYAGDADQNWQGGVPDRSGYIAFVNCTANTPANDGFDFKEGSQNIKVINCTVDWNNTTPGANNLGFSGVYDRATRIQILGLAARNNANPAGNAIRSHRLLASDGIYYGSGTEIVDLTATNLAGAAIYNVHTDTRLLRYTLTNVAGGLLESGSTTPTFATLFGEMTWPGEGGGVYHIATLPEPTAMLSVFALTLLLRRARESHP